MQRTTYSTYAATGIEYETAVEWFMEKLRENNCILDGEFSHKYENNKTLGYIGTFTANVIQCPQ